MSVQFLHDLTEYLDTKAKALIDLFHANHLAFAAQLEFSARGVQIHPKINM